MRVAWPSLQKWALKNKEGPAWGWWRVWKGKERMFMCPGTRRNKVSSYKFSSLVCLDSGVWGTGSYVWVIKQKKWTRARSGRALFIVMRNLVQLRSMRDSRMNIQMEMSSRHLEIWDQNTWVIGTQTWLKLLSLQKLDHFMSLGLSREEKWMWLLKVDQAEITIGARDMRPFSGQQASGTQGSGTQKMYFVMARRK